MNIDPVVFNIVNVCLGILFLSSGLQKLLNRQSFAAILEQYALLPAIILTPAAVIIPWLELACGLALLSPDLHQLAVAGIVVLLVVYAAAMLVNVRRGNVNIDCGCSFGVSQQTISMPLVWRNSLLAIIALSLFAPLGNREVGLFDYGVMVLGIIQFSLLYLIANTLMAQQAVSRELMS
jgi:uncharacterized membrane protein YphA (DoxX/SURF4 family)